MPVIREQVVGTRKLHLHICLAWGIVGLLTVGSVAVSHSFVSSWDPLPPTGMPHQALT